MSKELQEHCDHIAEIINDGVFIAPEDLGQYDDYEEGDMLSGWHYIADVYDFRWLVDARDNVLECQLMVAGGGPEIWVHISEDGSGRVEGYWWGDRATARITDDPMDVFDAAEELYLTKG
jgi:hypothetical protein